MCIHGDKSQPERDWVLAGKAAAITLLIYFEYEHCFIVFWSLHFFCLLKSWKYWAFFFILEEFRSGKAPILIATDVASRGLGMYLSLVSLSHLILLYFLLN